MSFGAQVITFKHYTPTGVADELGHKTLVPSEVDVPGCRHRPLTFKEMVELNFDVATEMWKSTIPIHEYNSTLAAAVNAATANDVIEVDGQEYQIVGGVRTHPDMDGRPYKTTIISTKQIG